MDTNQVRKANLQIRNKLRLIYTSSLIIAFLMVSASVTGLLYSNVIYPTDDLLQSSLTNDIVNLFIGMPILLGSMWLAWRDKLNEVSVTLKRVVRPS